MANTDLLQKIYLMAASSPSREICGLLVSSTQDFNIEIVPIINIAHNGQQFVMQKSGYFRALKKIKESGQEIFAVYHSHPNGDCRPSACDIEACRRTGLNYLIIANNQYCWVNP